ncbi:PLP-dependent transferase [Leekyejoonella antrihumi]|uniref:PLP-dependent transferase n=1 Tax=Leekyejoonella antrihumi TaxID=1660198 RepID=UPI00319DD7F3
MRRVRAITGALLHPLGAYLLHRGLATLPIRVRTQQAGALQVATWLAEHEAVDGVYFPGFDDTGVLAAQMRGPGAMVPIHLPGGYQQVRALIERLRLFTHAVSLGGVDSLVQHPASLTHRPVAAAARPADGLLRL